MARGERELVRCAAEGDPAAFEILDERYRRRLFGFVRARVADSEDTRDIVQEVFLEAFRGLSSFRGESLFWAWLVGIARNRIAAHYRRRWRLHENLPDEEVLDLQGEWSMEQWVDARRALQRCTELLRSKVTPLQHRVFHLRYAENRSILSIARDLGQTRENVKVRLFRARQRLRRSVPELTELAGG